MNVGDLIPDYLGVDVDGKEVMASDFAGVPLVIYFYPKDNTPGCTAEACSLCVIITANWSRWDIR